MSGARGPSEAEILLRSLTGAVLDVQERGEGLRHAVDRLIEVQAKLGTAGIRRLELDHEADLAAFIQVRRGEAFWDRSPTEPTPSALTEATP